MNARKKIFGAKALDLLALAFGLVALSSYVLGAVAMWFGIAGLAAVAFAVILCRVFTGKPSRHRTLSATPPEEL